MDRHNRKYIKKLYKCIIANTSAIWQQAAHTTDQLYTKMPNLLRKLFESVCFFWGGKSGEWTVSKNMAKTERARGLGRKIREEIGKGKGNQMTALRFQTGGRQTYDIPGLLSGDLCSKCIIVEIGARKTFHNETSLKYVHVNVFKAVIVDI